jgi:cysteine dioxygenase
MQCVRTDTMATIDELRAVLEMIRQPLTVVQLIELTSRLQLSSSQWREHLVFDPERFSFRTIGDSPHLEINVIGWQSGQFSSIHDHRGTACCVLVLDGVLTNIDYRFDSANELHETSRVDLRLGEILSRSDREIHCCGNEQPCGTDLATLHLYSPPLRPLAERQYHE